MDLERLPAKIADRLMPIPFSGCWVWTGGEGGNGYGSFHKNKRQIMVHRFVYEALVGPIPTGLVIDHLCRVRLCANPLHMRVVTIGQNVLAGVGISATNARKTHCKRGHPFDEANTWIEKNGARHCRRCNYLNQTLVGR